MKIMKKDFYISLKSIFIIVLITIITSCSNIPNESRVKKELREQVETESNGYLELIELKKTDGLEREFMGQKTYSLEYTAKLRVKSDCYMYVNPTGYGSYFKNFKTYSNKPELILNMQRQIVSCTKDDEVNFKDIIVYIKTEKGWKKTKKSIF